MTFTRKKFPDWFLQAWPESRLDAMKDQGDDLADATVAAIFAKGDREMVNAIMPLLDKPETWPANTPPELADYLARSEQLPPWADQEILARTYKFIELHGVRYNLVLLFLALPILNAWKVGGAQTLAMTGQLTQHFVRRLSETLRFVRAVIDRDGMSVFGQGIRTTQKVRLMHATIRYYSRFAGGPKKPYWQSEWGKPINQEALSATMLAFSTVSVDGLRKLGVDVTEQEEADLLHLWKVIGHVLGIRDENMPGSIEEARFLWKKCVQRNFGRSDAGVMLTQKHIEFIGYLAKDDEFLAMGLRRTDAALLRYLMGYKIAVKMLGVPRPGVWGWMVVITRLIFGLTEKIVDMDKSLQTWLEQHSDKLLELLQKFWDQQDSSRPFQMPSKEDAQGGLPAPTDKDGGPGGVSAPVVAKAEAA